MRRAFGEGATPSAVDLPIAESYQQVTVSHGRELHIPFSLAGPFNRLSGCVLLRRLNSFAGFWWVQSPFTCISLLGPKPLL